METLTALTPLIGNASGTQFKDWVMVIAGNLFIVILVVRALGYWGQKAYGELVGHIALAVLIAGFIYFPNQTIDLLKAIWNMFTA